MSLEFQCGDCAATLKVDQQLAGKLARCPQCQSVQSVPTMDGIEAAPDPLATVEQPISMEAVDTSDSTMPSSNPYATPQQNDASAPGIYLPQESIGGITPTQINVGDVLSHTLDVWKQRLGLLVGATLLYYAVSIGFSLIVEAIEFVNPQNRNLSLVLASFSLDIASSVVDFWLGIGLAKLYLAVTRRQDASFGILFSGGDRFFATLGGTILFVLGTIGLTLLLIIPGIIFMLWAWPYYYLIIDRQCHVFPSFSVAIPMGRLNWFNSILLSVISFGIAILGLLALVIGFVFAAPFIGVMLATAYVMMKGETPHVATTPKNTGTPLTTPML